MSYLDIKLEASDGNTYSLRDFAGKKLVVYFYPKDNTSGCTLEAKSFTNLKEDYKKKGYTILGVSPDSVKSHLSFIDKQDLDLLLLSDPQKELIEAFDVYKEKSMYGKKYMGVERSTFLLDETGEIMNEYRKVKAGSHPEELLKEIK